MCQVTKKSFSFHKLCAIIGFFCGVTKYCSCRRNSTEAFSHRRVSVS